MGTSNVRGIQAVDSQLRDQQLGSIQVLAFISLIPLIVMEGICHLQ